jgi:hypothetical protein
MSSLVDGGGKMCSWWIERIANGFSGCSVRRRRRTVAAEGSRRYIFMGLVQTAAEFRGIDDLPARLRKALPLELGTKALLLH